MIKDNNSYLTFRLNGELFAIGVQKVLEIIETSEDHKLTHLPKAPETVEGVVNFRGQVIPIVNTRMKFDLAAYKKDEKFVIMVLNLIVGGKEQVIGAMADKVVDVIEISEDDVKPVPEVGKGYNSEFIKGVVYRDNEFIMMLDLEKAIDSDEILALNEEESTEKIEELTEV